MMEYEVPILKPKLPLAEKIIPYLQLIDEKRQYTNFGPLTTLFIDRLAELFCVQPNHLVPGSNGTILLELALRAICHDNRGYCIIPSWTFTATACAAINAGLTPYFIDVDLSSGQLTSNNVLEKLECIQKEGNVAAILPVSPFGSPVDRHSWDTFTEITGIPVLIDAAASFDTINQVPIMSVGKTPMMVSLHATKVFGIGEGGLILSLDEKLIERIRCLTQFGFAPTTRVSHYTGGTNAKISEYTAAVGLAALDGWPQQRTAWCTTRDNYINLFQHHSIQHQLNTNWISGTCNIFVHKPINALEAEFAKINIQTRRWWEQGCHQQNAFLSCPRTDDLSNTEYLGKHILGIPFYTDLSLTSQQEIVKYISIHNQ